VSDRLVEKFNKQLHERDHFDCGVDVLNIYLKTRAQQEQKKRLNITYVAVANSRDKQKPILGYYTLSNSSIALMSMQPELRRHMPVTYDIPSVKIGRLAVDGRFSGEGLGRLLLKDACNRIMEIAALCGTKGIEVLAKDDRSAQFYQKFGFQKLLDTRNALFLSIETILKIIGQ